MSKQKQGTTKEAAPEKPGQARMKIDGDEVIVTGEGLLYNPETAEEDTVQIASSINLFGQYLAKAERQKVMVDAEYREWRARQTVDLLAKDSKLAEWKVKAKIEATERFMLFKTGISTAECNVHALRAILEALKAKKEILLIAMAGRTTGSTQRP